jgi:hypothetical protein
MLSQPRPELRGATARMVTCFDTPGGATALAALNYSPAEACCDSVGGKFRSSVE